MPASWSDWHSRSTAPPARASFSCTRCSAPRATARSSSSRLSSQPWTSSLTSHTTTGTSASSTSAAACRDEPTLDDAFDYDRFARLLLTKALEVCARHGAKPPALIGEFGRYTVSEHAAHLFRVIAAKPNGTGVPWYLVDGSIMTSFPDTWALGEHFICLPLNHLDRPFRHVRLGGITCDRDDVYPPRGSAAPLFLPEIAATDLDETPLYVGFFSVGAYQEMLGGVRGSKHCVLPEATELLIDDGEDGGFVCDIVPGHSTEDVLHNLGYGRTARVGAPRTAAAVALASR